MFHFLELNEISKAFVLSDVIKIRRGVIYMSTQKWRNSWSWRNHLHLFGDSYCWWLSCVAASTPNLIGTTMTMLAVPAATEDIQPFNIGFNHFGLILVESYSSNFVKILTHSNLIVGLFIFFVIHFLLKFWLLVIITMSFVYAWCEVNKTELGFFFHAIWYSLVFLMLLSRL